MSKPDIIIDDTDTGALFVSTTDDGRVKFSIAIKGESTVAEVDLTPERAEDIARLVMDAVRKVRPTSMTGAGGGGTAYSGGAAGGGGGSSWPPPFTIPSGIKQGVLIVGGKGGVGSEDTN